VAAVTALLQLVVSSKAAGRFTTIAEFFSRGLFQCGSIVALVT
jgi:hypothetical protein